MVAPAGHSEGKGSEVRGGGPKEIEPAGFELALAGRTSVAQLLRTDVAEVEPASPALEIENLDVVAFRARSGDSYKSHSQVASIERQIGKSAWTRCLTDVRSGGAIKLAGRHDHRR